MHKIILSFTLIVLLMACKKPGAFDHLDNNAHSFDAYVKEHSSEVVKEWMYHKDAIKGRYVLFQNSEMMYMRHFRWDEKIIYSEEIEVIGLKFKVVGVEGNYYQKSPKGNLNVFEGGKRVNVLYNLDL